MNSYLFKTHRVFLQKNNDNSYILYKNKDIRDLALWVIEYIKFDYIVFPEEVPLLLQLLDTSENEIEQAHNKMQI